MKKSLLAIVPARKGSKGVKGKNVREINGKKLISYTVEAALKSKFISKLIISTDCDDVISSCTNLGVNVEAKRPDYLCTEDALTVDVLNYEIQKLHKKNEFFDYLLLLQPTSPLRTTEDIDNAFELMQRNDCDSLISVTNVNGNHPLRMKLIRDKYLFNYIETGNEDMRPRQILPKVYIRNGAIYLAKMSYFQNNISFGSEKCIAYEMPEDRSINIDSEKDLIILDYYIKKSNKNNTN